MPLSPAEIRGLHPRIAKHLAEIERLLPASYKMTLLIRNAQPGEYGIGDWMMSVDDSEEVRRTLDRLSRKGVSPGIIPARVQ